MTNREPITYKDLQQLIDIMKNDKQPEFVNRFYCNEYHMLMDTDIEKLYPKTKQKRIDAAKKSVDGYLVTWRGLRFYLIKPMNIID